MGRGITPLRTSRQFNPLAQPLEASQKLGGRQLVGRFDGGDITSDGGALVLQQLEQRAAQHAAADAQKLAQSIERAPAPSAWAPQDADALAPLQARPQPY